MSSIDNLMLKCHLALLNINLEHCLFYFFLVGGGARYTDFWEKKIKLMHLIIVFTNSKRADVNKSDTNLAENIFTVPFHTKAILPMSMSWLTWDSLQ